MKAVLDSSVFLSEFPVEGSLFTTPSVIDELVDLCSKCRHESLLAQGLTVMEPSEEALAAVDRAARDTGDAGVISATDRDVLALAHDLGAVLVTDDFAVQNVASRLKVRTVPILQRSARPVRWRFRCTGCGRYFREPGTCQICGSEIKRKLK